MEVENKFGIKKWFHANETEVLLFNCIAAECCCKCRPFELHECANDTNSDGEGPATHSSSLKVWWGIWTFTCA